MKKLISTLYGMLMSAFLAVALVPTQAFSDETCMSPYMAKIVGQEDYVYVWTCLLYTSPSPRDGLLSRMPSSA